MKHNFSRSCSKTFFSRSYLRVICIRIGYNKSWRLTTLLPVLHGWGNSVKAKMMKQNIFLASKVSKSFIEHFFHVFPSPVNNPINYYCRSLKRYQENKKKSKEPSRKFISSQLIWARVLQWLSQEIYFLRNICIWWSEKKSKLYWTTNNCCCCSNWTRTLTN